MKEVVDWAVQNLGPNVLKYTTDQATPQQLFESGAIDAVGFWNSLARLEYLGGHTEAALLVPPTIYRPTATCGSRRTPSTPCCPGLHELAALKDVQFPNDWPIDHGQWSELSEGFLGPDYVDQVPDWFTADYFTYFPKLDQIQSGFKTIDWEAYNASSKSSSTTTAAARPVGPLTRKMWLAAATAGEPIHPRHRGRSWSVNACRCRSSASPPSSGGASATPDRPRPARPPRRLALLVPVLPPAVHPPDELHGGQLVSVAGGSGPDDRQLRPHPRTLPAEPVRDDPAGPAGDAVDLVLGFPFAYILVRRVRYRDVVRALMVFPMFGALYVTFGISTVLLPGGLLAPFFEALGVSARRCCSACHRSCSRWRSSPSRSWS